ncbi:TraR/DksA C4-type zinc finger protein [Marinobacterium litorale]|uniref:TraR/DksA C4-type zinc finger protein n=1 Tax=Marinobacterium litorale TaxID=404770 RepID=UPI0003FE00F9|nr:TraR/DksA C4-type zinc finger protein [Marinobacterium litorale]
MPDLYDRAQEREQQNTQDAQAHYRASLSPEPEQVIVAGCVLCIDCDEPVQAARLAAKPNAARCIYCQGEYEKEQRRHG